MATTIINPAQNTNSSNSGLWFLLGAIFLIVFAALFFVYAIPYVRGLSGGAIQIDVPKSIDVKVQQSK